MIGKSWFRKGAGIWNEGIPSSTLSPVSNTLSIKWLPSGFFEWRILHLLQTPSKIPSIFSILAFYQDLVIWSLSWHSYLEVYMPRSCSRSVHSLRTQTMHTGDAHQMVGKCIGARVGAQWVKPLPGTQTSLSRMLVWVSDAPPLIQVLVNVTGKRQQRGCFLPAICVRSGRSPRFPTMAWPSPDLCGHWESKPANGTTLALSLPFLSLCLPTRQT